MYADRDPPIATTLADYRTQHRTALTGADITAQDYKALRARMPVFTTWDDHDIANDFSGGTGDALYAPAKQAFQEYGARANPDSLTAGELYYTFQCGDVGFFVLDSRSFRSSNSATDNSSKTLLGATQKAALKNWLLTNKDTLKLKFICASTPAHGYAANTGGDSWGGVDDGTQAPNGANGFRTERNEIWDYIDANQIPGVVIISGDQHWAGSFKTTYANRPRYEFMSTPLNMTNTASFMLTEVARTADPVNGPVFWKLDNTMNVGVVSVDTTVSPATVSFQLYGTGGSLGASYLTSINADDINANLVPAPAITLSATFPSSPHVGDTVSFDVTATLVGGATGALTVTVDQLPAGLALGTTSQVDATHYKATVSGTLTNVQDITSTFGATGGSVAATSLVHDFNVTAATATAPGYVVGAADYVYPGVSAVPLPAGCQAGDFVVIAGNSSNTSNALKCTAGTQLLAPTGGKNLTIYGYTLTATDIANGSFPANVTYSYEMGIWRAPTGVGVDVVGAPTTFSAFANLTVANVTTTATHTALTAIFGRGTGASNDAIPTPYPAGWSLVANSPVNGYGLGSLRFDDFTPAGTTSSPNFGQNSFTTTTILIALKPL